MHKTSKFCSIIFFLLLLITSLIACTFDSHNSSSQSNNIHFEKNFIEGTQDIPLAEGLEIMDNNNNIEFDTILGSFNSVSYKLNEDKEKTKIKKFYQDSLPKLGWEINKLNKDSMFFQRDNQKLNIKFIEQDSEKIVVFANTISDK